MLLEFEVFFLKKRDKNNFFFFLDLKINNFILFLLFKKFFFIFYFIFRTFVLKNVHLDILKMKKFVVNVMNNVVIVLYLQVIAQIVLIIEFYSIFK
jgi:hypothetical protein